jgi:hypothetical protein
MVGSIRTTPIAQNVPVGAPASKRVVDPWHPSPDEFRASAPPPTALAEPPAVAPEAPAPRVHGLARKLFAISLAVGASLAGAHVLVAHPGQAAQPAPLPVVQVINTIAVPLPQDSAGHLDPAVWHIATDARPVAEWSDMASTRPLAAPALALHPEPFSLLHGDSLLSYDAHGHRFDRQGHPAEKTAPRPVHHSYPRIVVQKGDYVAHGVNFSTLLSNEEFTDVASLDQKQIQALLEKNDSFLATYKESGRLASQIIYDAAQASHVNPRVILATLEKENSLISRQSKPAAWVMRSAMGYGYDDGGGTAGRHSTFAWQVGRGSQLLRSLYDEGVQQSLPMKMRVDYGHRRLRVNNAATYALMKYTPHTRDTQMRHVGGGNYLFSSVLRRVNTMVDQMEKSLTSAKPT